MFAPIRALTAVRPEASPGVLGAAAATAVVFAATPFLVPAVAGGFGVTLGTAGLLSTAQVGGFAVASFVAGRLLTPTRSLLRVAMAALTLLNLGSAADISWETLLGARAMAGASMGIVTWIAWADATRFVRGIGDVAAIAPVAATVASPLLGILAATAGHRTLYLVLAVVTAAVVLLPVEVADVGRIGRSISPSRSNRVLLVAMAVLTLAGSGVFVFAAAAGQRAGLPAASVPLVFSLNALAGIAATRLGPRRGRTGLWIATTAVAAAVTGGIASAPMFVLAMAVWGFAFWMAVPQMFVLLAERARRPDERVGDAQSMMAIGRAAGPALGGIALGGGRFGLLGALAGVAMLTSAAAVAAVEHRRAGLP